MNISQLSIRNKIARLRCQRIAPLLVPYADDRLRRAERERVEGHVENCPACRAEVQTIVKVSALLRNGASNAPTPTAGLSPNLWVGIEAEIRRSGVPLDRSAESPLLRPRRRVGLGWDAAWPSSVPIAAAVFSAIMFGTVLLNHHALTAHITPATSGVMKSDDTIELAIRPSASVSALAVTDIEPAAPAIVLSSAGSPLSLARAEAAAPGAHRARAVVSGVHRAMPTAAGSSIAVVSRPNATRNSFAAKPTPTVTLASIAPLRASFPSAPALTVPHATGMALADNDAARMADHATMPLYTLGIPPSNIESARSAEVRGSDTDASVKTADIPIVTVSSASDNTMSVAASKPIDDDATVRSGAPADQPMADFTALSRRQRSLFSYTSR